jgi:hypothetical protein
MSAIIRAAGVSALAAIALAATTAPAPASSGARAPAGRLVLVQAVPDESLDVSIDGRPVETDSATGAVLGPYAVSPGQHRVEFTSSSHIRLVSTVDVASGSSRDVVVHLPAQVDGSPVVNTYRTPTAPIAPGKARVLVAHTATVAPADVRVDGTVVFRDIANGEYATADVAAGAHTASLLPTGVSGPPLLGPLELDLEPGTVTSVYAVGSPEKQSMNVIVHTTALTSNGAVAPASIDTGSAGLARDVPVHTFAVDRAAVAGSAAPAVGHDAPGPLVRLALVGGGGALLVWWVGWQAARRRPLPPG